MPWVVARPVHHLPADADVGVDEVGSAAGHADADHSALGLPESPDVLAMLRHQATVTCEGMVALVDWANAEPDAAQRVRDCEHRADDTKRELRLALTNAFITPIDAEDLYVMSERLDAVLNGAKDTVRESEVMGIPPDEAVAAMATLLAEGIRHLAAAFERLDPDKRGKDPASATEAADAAVKSQRRLERVYREAASALLKVDDLRRSWAGGSCTDASRG